MRLPRNLILYFTLEKQQYVKIFGTSRRNHIHGTPSEVLAKEKKGRKQRRLNLTLKWKSQQQNIIAENRPSFFF